MRVYVMVGGPGAGKGTQANLLAERLGLPHVSSGDLFRRHLRDDTALGRQARRYIDRGALVPDELTISMIEDRLAQADAREGAILDGFPRTRPQAEALDALLERKGGQLAAAFYLDVDRDVLLRRLSGRLLCAANGDHVYHGRSHRPKVAGRCDIDDAPLYQRDDDSPATVQARLETQLPPMFEVVDYYADRGVLRAVDGDQPVDEVTDALLRTVVSPAK